MTEKDTMSRDLERFLKKLFKGMLGATMMAYFVQIMKKTLSSEAICEFGDAICECESAQDVYDVMRTSSDELVRDCAVILWDIMKMVRVAAEKIKF